MPEEIKEKIIEFLKENADKEFSILQLKKKIGFSYSVITKWAMVLEAENKVQIKDYGNIKLVSIKDGAGWLKALAPG